MKNKRGSLLGNIGQGLAGDVLLFAVVILVMSLFAISSISSAYLMVFALLIVAIVSFALYKRATSKADS